MANIIIVDDDPTIRIMVRDFLESAGHMVFDVDDGIHVSRLVHNEKIDLILTDIFMPEKEGLETIMEVKGEFPSLPVIAMSSGGTSNAMVQGGVLGIAEEMGADATIGKPVHKEELLATVNKLLS